MEKTKVVSNDGYTDIVSQIGAKASKSARAAVVPQALFMPELVDAYGEDGIAQKITRIPATDALASGFEIVGDADGSLQKSVNAKKLGFRKAVRKAAKWTRLYGGAVVVLLIADGRKLEESAGSGEIVKIDCFSAGAIELSDLDFCKDKGSENFGNPDFFNVVMPDGSRIKVHYTRCVVFYGEDVPDDSRTMRRFTLKDRFFGLSALAIVIGRLKKMGLSEEGVADMMSEVNIGLFKLKGLDQKLSSRDGMSVVKKRFEAIEMGKSMCRAIIGDVDEDYSNVHTDLGGVPETLYRQMQLLSAASDIPMARLFGESGSGLSATGEGNQKLYDNMVESWREEHLTESVEAIVAAILSRNVAKRGKLEEYEIQWNPVSKPSDKEYVELCNMQANMYHTLIQDGVLSPEEVRTMMFKGGHTFQMMLPEEDGE